MNYWMLNTIKESICMMLYLSWYDLQNQICPLQVWWRLAALAFFTILMEVAMKNGYDSQYTHRNVE